MTLPGSTSFLRIGILTRELDPERMNDCGDDVLLNLARSNVGPETTSLPKLSAVTTPAGLSAVCNDNASRLNTEFRRQCTFFIPTVASHDIALQPYLSFVPHFGSPELQEMEETFNGDMRAYIEHGRTAVPIRAELERFAEMVGTLVFHGE